MSKKYPGARELSNRRDAFFHPCTANYYHNVPDRASSTILKLCLRSGQHAQHQIRWPRTATDSMQFGTLVHWIMEEPHWRDLVAVSPKFDLRKKPDKERRKAFLDENEGKEIITDEHYKALVRIERNVQSRPNLMTLLDSAKHEVSGFWTSRYEIPCKFRADAITQDNVIIDFKTCQDATRFKWDVLKWKYHLQAAFYLEGLGAIVKEDLNDFIFVAIENTPPYDLKVFHLDRDSLDAGRKLVCDAMLVYKENSELKEWGGYPDTIETLSLF